MNPTVLMTGYKTYIVGIAMVLFGASGIVMEVHDWDTGVKIILEGLGIMGLRAAMTTEVKKTKE